MSTRLSSVASDIEDAEVLIIDAAAHEWCCGWAESNGPDVVLPGVSFGDHAAWSAAMAEVFEKMEAEPSEIAVLLCEPPGVTAADREHVAATLFGEHRVCALHVASAPVLALYNTGFTGIVVDVGEDAAAIHPIYDGVALLEAATHHLLADAVPLHEAIVRTANLADASLRGALLHAVVLAGHGSVGGDFAAQLEREIKAALDSTKWQPYAPPRLGARYASPTLAQIQIVRPPSQPPQPNALPCSHARVLPRRNTQARRGAGGPPAGRVAWRRDPLLDSVVD